MTLKTQREGQTVEWIYSDLAKDESATTLQEERFGNDAAVVHVVFQFHSL